MLLLLIFRLELYHYKQFCCKVHFYKYIPQHFVLVGLYNSRHTNDAIHTLLLFHVIIMLINVMINEKYREFKNTFNVFQEAQNKSVGENTYFKVICFNSNTIRNAYLSTILDLNIFDLFFQNGSWLFFAILRK